MNQEKKREKTGPEPTATSETWLPTLFVGIGASAGGLEAIETFFTHMPPDSGFAFIVIQHLSPDYKSLMVELLSKRTEMGVLRAEDGMVVQRNKVYLIPPKKNLKIFHGKLLLHEQDFSRGLNLPIDIFLRSLAEDQGEKAVGIILSGTGSDGMRGTRSIKENGGMIMVQDEETAKFDGMPRSAISTGLADFVLPPEDMPSQLMAFAKHPYTAKADRAEALLSDEDGLTRIFALLREKSKVDFTYYKPSTVIRRIERRMSVNQIEDIREYVRYLQNYPGEIMALYRELLIGVTSFFRDQEAFKQLEEKWLPELFKRKEESEIRFWVAGCSTGEEAYTFAILAREVMEETGRLLDLKIFATDVDKDAIMRAGSGVYPASIAADLSPRLLAKYFYHKDDNFQISRNIREMVVFAQHNLVKDPPFTNIDLVSTRNLLIYLQPVLQKKVLELINFSLNPGGVLVLGTSETVGEMSNYFETVSQKFKIYKSSGRIKPTVNPQELLTISDRKTREIITRQPGAVRGFRVLDTEKILERLLDSVSGDYMPLTLVVNDQMEVQHVFGNTDGYFRVPSGRISNDITKMASKDLSIPLTTGIQKVFRSNTELRFANIQLRYSESTKSINLRVKPLPQKKGQEPLVAVFLSEVKTKKHELPADIGAYDLSKEAEQRIRDLEQELQFTKENLQATIEELETANEELQATNEELLASNEELQSTNEELQSTNEELHTVNSEYQNKIIELTELNNDVDNLLASAHIGALLLDENLEIRKFSPQVSDVLLILDNDVGRPINHINHRITNKDPYEIIRRVQRSPAPAEEQVRLENGRWYLMRVVPYAIGPQKYSGIVVTFVEISQIKEAQEALIQSESLLKRTADLAKVGSWEYNVGTGEHSWSEETFRIHELESGNQPNPAQGIEFYTRESKPIIMKAFQKACEQGTPYDLVLEIVTAKGNHKWVRAIGLPQLENDRVKTVEGAFQDITGLKELSEALRESEQRYQELFNAMNEGFALHELITDERGEPVDYRFLDVNPSFEKLTGLRREAIIGRSVLDVLPETETYWIQLFGRVALTGIPNKMENYSQELGRWYSVAAYSPRPGRFCAIFSDVTDRKNKDEELRQSEELFRSLFETLGQGVVYQDAAGRIIRANPAAQRILGLSLDQMQGRTFTDPSWRAVREDGSDFPGGEHPAMVALETGAPVEKVIMGIFNPTIDKTRWIKVNAMPQLRSGEERPYQVYTTFEDLTAQYMADKELQTLKERLDRAFAAANMGWWDWDLVSGKVTVSPKKYEMLGYEVDEIGETADDWTALIHDDDYHDAMVAMRCHLEGKKDRYDVRYRLRQKDGEYLWLRDRGIIVERDDRGSPKRLIGAVQKLDGSPEGC